MEVGHGMKKLKFKSGTMAFRLSLLALLELLCWMDTGVASACQADGMVVVGSGESGIRMVRFDACTGSFIGPVQLAADASKVRWLLRHPQRPVLYAAVEGGEKQGLVQAYVLDERRGTLASWGEAGSGGSGPTHLWLDETSQTVMVANFGSGSVSSVPLQTDGRLGALTQTLAATGSGPHRRQASAHAHGVVVDPSGRHVLVADMGSDRVWVYGFDRNRRSLQAAPPASPAPISWRAPEGSGPRRALFGRDGRHVYVLGELDAAISVLSWNPQSVQLAEVQRLDLSRSAAPGSTTNATSASEMALSRDGRFLYVANRGENSLEVYRVDQDSGQLSLLQTLPSGGDAPWAFDIHASGRWLLVANYRSNQLRLLGIDSTSGLLTDMGQSVDTPAPVSVLFAN